MGAWAAVISAFAFAILLGCQLERRFERERHEAVITAMAENDMRSPEYRCATGALVWHKDVREPWFAECVKSVKVTGSYEHGEEGEK